MRRNDPRMLLARTYEAAVVYVPFMLCQRSIATILPSWAGTPWTILVIYYSLTRINVIFADYLTTKWQVGPEGIRLSTGWPFREETHVSWREVGSIKVHQGWLARLLRISRVVLTVGAEQRSSLILEAVSRRQLLQIHALHEVAPSKATPFADDTSLIYRARTRDFFLIGFTHGQFFFFLPFLIGTGSEALSFFGINLFALPLSLPTLLAGMIGAGAYGIFRSLITYGRYRVARTETGFTVTGGLIQRTSFEIQTSEVVGARVDRNPLMQLSGHCSICLILARGRSDIKVLPILPVTRYADAQAELGALLGTALLPSPGRSLRFSSFILATGILLAGAAGWFLSLWAAGLILLISLYLANLLAADITQEQGLIMVRRGIIGVSLRALSSEAVRNVSVLYRVVPRPAPHAFLTVTVLDRRPLRLHIPAVSLETARALTVI